jgi:hypothetical protein
VSDVEEVRELVKKIHRLTSTLKTELTAPRTHDQLLAEVCDLDSIKIAEEFATSMKRFHRRGRVEDCRPSLTAGKRETRAELDADAYASQMRERHRK